MIRKVQIENYKSIAKLDLDLGRVTVLIGANGSGKSNILEAIALAAAAAQNKLDNEFLSSRGIRVTQASFMRSRFGASATPAGAIGISFLDEAGRATERTVGPGEIISLSIGGDGDAWLQCRLFADEGGSYPKWMRLQVGARERYVGVSPSSLAAIRSELARCESKLLDAEREVGVADSYDRTALDELRSLLGHLRTHIVRYEEQFGGSAPGPIPGFLVYSPENSALRTFQGEGQILPLGIRGEGLFGHLKGLETANPGRLREIRDKLALIDWFETFVIPDDLSPGERSIRIRDRFLAEGALFDQRSANEGFLFLLFYITLLISPETPAFFAIDNVDSSLNPKLCLALLQQIVALAKQYDKQVILTTHNPAVLDGLDLHDDEQRLLVVDRNKSGHTRVRRVDAPKPSTGAIPVSLSEAFMRGYIGGLPNNF